MNAPTPTVMARGWPVARTSVSCALVGHKVHYTRITAEGCAPCARCDAAILNQGNGLSRVAHTLSCFFFKHQYMPVATRRSHHEYFCEKCGHSLLLELARDRYHGNSKFKKRVSYACGLFGHHVHIVATRSKATEYACRCGHSFVKAQAALKVIRHPLKCVLLGHVVTASEIRPDWAEYVCHRCGHPFYFRYLRLAAFAQRGSSLYARRL